MDLAGTRWHLSATFDASWLEVRMRYAALSLLLTGAVPAAVVTGTHGPVSIRHPEQSFVSPAAAGQWLHPGDRIRTGVKAGASVQVDSVHQFDLAPESEVLFLESDEQHHLLQLTGGSIYWRVYGSASTDVSVETPNVTARPVLPGEYSIAVKTGVVEIAAYHGDLEVFAPQGSEWVYAGRKMWVRGPASQPEFRLGYAYSWWQRAGLALSNLARRMNTGASAGAGGSNDSADSDSNSGSSSAKSSPTHAESPRAGAASHTANSPSPGGPAPGRR